jgi:hypothetical protein
MKYKENEGYRVQAMADSELPAVKQQTVFQRLVTLFISHRTVQTYYWQVSVKRYYNHPHQTYSLKNIHESV